MSTKVLSNSYITLQLRANDFDWSKYMNNSNYFQLFEQGRWDWQNINNLNLVESELVGVVARMKIDYIKPIYWDPLKEVAVETSVEKQTQFSITLKQVLKDLSNVYCIAEIQLTLFNMQTKRPEKVKQVLER